MFESLRAKSKVPDAGRSEVWEVAVRTGGPAQHHTLVLTGVANGTLVF